MGRDTCRMPGCDKEPGTEDSDKNYNEYKYCGPFHEVKYEHLKADADDARRSEQERPEVERRDLPEYDGPPY